MNSTFCLLPLIGLRAVYARLLTLLLCVLAMNARAEGTWDNCVRGGSSAYQYFPATNITLGRDAEVGEPVGPWISASEAQAWTCTRRASYGGTAVQVAIQGFPPYNLLGSLSEDGVTYGYYAAGNASNPPLGYIVRWRAKINGVDTDWTPLTITTSGQQTPASTVTVAVAAGATYIISVETQIRFVKRTAALVAGYRLVVLDPIYVRFLQQVAGGTFVGGGTYRISQMRAGAATFEGGGTCTTPDVDVKLPDTPAGEFSGVGTVIGLTPFDLSFRNCPPNLASIDYSFAPTTSVLDAANGVVGLNGTSNASGVGIQLLTQSGQPVQFGTLYPLSSYDPSQTSSYNVGLQVGYYQTDAEVTAGHAETAVTFTMSYK